MNGRSRIPPSKEKIRRARSAPRPEGFTLFELLVVVAIIGMLSFVLIPNIMNSLEARTLENTTREMMSTMQRAKFQAVKTRINHRIRFEYRDDIWFYFIEREDNPGDWVSMPGFNYNLIPPKFNVTVNFPSQMVQFSPLGFVSNYDSSQNSVTIQSPKLDDQSQPDERIVSVYIGGSFKYDKTTGGE
ncbi:MAG: prepilin-type N-terminal cleavage/methylation domain-containing protein [Candidatus Aminicenantes bacterium]|nr:MAG: prepilin-type N-terminal cleavage/methylation domain-containing protein [Candidatus Aminicenantes bacterium]